MKKIIMGMMLIISSICMADFKLKDMDEFKYNNAYIGMILVTEDDRLLMEVKINKASGLTHSSLIEIDNQDIYPKMLKFLELDGDLLCTEWEDSRVTQERMFKKDIYSRMKYDDFIRSFILR